MNRSGPYTICLFGGAPDTGNLGVSALGRSVLTEISRRLPDARLVVFDEGRGVRPAVLRRSGGDVPHFHAGASPTRRVYRRESLWHIRVAARLGGLGNPSAREIRDATAVLDLSGGDSFTDLYGPRRFRTVALPKLAALSSGTPLFLLPQTFGPFRSSRHRRTAERIARAADLAIARDDDSFARLSELLGGEVDPNRHFRGVDVAFLLEAERPAEPGGAEELVAGDRPTAGINVSGLLVNDPEGARRRYGLTADYEAAIRALVARLLSETDHRILLVPHVTTPPGQAESDVTACRKIRDAVPERDRGRVAVAPAYADPRHVKWLIARTDWFCGTRMHSTIASLSTGVPTAGVAYSVKMRGVFATAGQEARVADARRLDTEALLGKLHGAFLERERTAAELARRMPRVKAEAARQFDAIVRRIGTRGARIREAARA